MTVARAKNNDSPTVVLEEGEVSRQLTEEWDLITELQ